MMTKYWREVNVPEAVRKHAGNGGGCCISKKSVWKRTHPSSLYAKVSSMENKQEELEVSVCSELSSYWDHREMVG